MTFCEFKMSSIAYVNQMQFFCFNDDIHVIYNLYILSSTSNCLTTSKYKENITFIIVISMLVRVRVCVCVCVCVCV